MTFALLYRKRYCKIHIVFHYFDEVSLNWNIFWINIITIWTDQKYVSNKVIMAHSFREMEVE